MSIITFWNDTREQTGRTLTSAVVATRMAIERNSKILLVSTSVSDSTMRKCFFDVDNKNIAFLNKNSNIGVETGIEGLFKLISSKKLTPDIITDYTRVVFKDRLEVITGANGDANKSEQENQKDFISQEENFIDLIRTANQHYDMVIVDLDKMLTDKTREDILRISDVNVYVLSQKLESINRYVELRDNNQDLIRNRCIPVVGKYISKYKYNSKNIARYLQQKNELDLMPFNLLYMEAAEESCVPDLVLKLKNIKDKTDENYIFMQCTLNLMNNIIKKLQDLQMRMR